MNNAGQIDGNGGSISSGLLNKSLMFPPVVVVVIVLVVTVVVVVIIVVDFLGILLIHIEHTNKKEKIMNNMNDFFIIVYENVWVKIFNPILLTLWKWRRHHNTTKSTIFLCINHKTIR